MYPVVFVLSLLWLHAESNCTFPSAWQGNWFRAGVGEVEIKGNKIKEQGKQKGTCIDHSSDKYLLENREGDCVSCLLMMHRHDNVIQYKEGYCVPGAKSLAQACGKIRVEDTLYTLIREGSQPVRCPFQSAYHFIYKNNTAEFCSQPRSYVKPCASSSKFNFRFRSCPDVPDTYDRELKFECLADWKDGSDTYIYGGFSGNGIFNRDDIYRCFMYQSLGADVNLAMSADASCRGLRSPTDGPLAMQFERDTTGWPQEACTFPDWMSGVTWQDLSGRHLYTLDTKAEVLRMVFQRRPAKLHTQASFRCLEVIDDNTTDRQFVAITLTTHGCDTTRQCIRVLRRNSQVLEIHQGRIKENSIKECLETDIINQTRHHLVIPQNMELQPCPFPGKYVLEHSQPECTGHLHIGCNGTSVIGVDIDSKCKAQAGYRNGHQLECMKTWEEDDRRYVIARRLGDDGPLSNCFALEKQFNSYQLYTDRNCNLGAPYFHNEVSRYTFSGPTVDCSEGSYAIEEGIQGAAPMGEGQELMREGTPTSTASSTLAGSGFSRTLLCALCVVLTGGLRRR